MFSVIKIRDITVKHTVQERTLRALDVDFDRLLAVTGDTVLSDFLFHLGYVRVNTPVSITFAVKSVFISRKTVE